MTSGNWIIGIAVYKEVSCVSIHEYDSLSICYMARVRNLRSVICILTLIPFSAAAMYPIPSAPSGLGALAMPVPSPAFVYI